MSDLVTIIPNPAFKPEPAQKAAFDAIKKHGPVKDVPLVTATENVKQSGGMYVIQAAVSAPVEAAAPSLDTMSSEDLKVMMLKLGIVPQKQMKRPEVIKAIRLKLDEVTIADDDDA